jgi:hypothetical protein
LSDDRTPVAHELGGAEHSDTTFSNINNLIADATLVETLDARLSDNRTADAIATSGADVVQGTTPPTANQVIKASSPTAAAWDDLLFTDITGTLVPGNFADDTIEVSVLASAVDGELITWDSGGVATTVPVGTIGHVLTSGGTGAEPTFQIIGTDTIADDAVTYTKIQNVTADNRLLGTISGAGTVVEELSGTQVTAMLDTATTSLPGLGPARTGGASTDYLSADGTYTVPPGGSAATLTKSITIENPVTAEDITFFYTPVPITVTQVAAVIRGTSPSVHWYIKFATMTIGRNSIGTVLITAGTTTDDEGGVSITSFDDATIPADSFVWIETTTVSGTNDELALTVVYTED